MEESFSSIPSNESFSQEFGSYSYFEPNHSKVKKSKKGKHKKKKSKRSYHHHKSSPPFSPPRTSYIDNCEYPFFVPLYSNHIEREFDGEEEWRRKLLEHLGDDELDFWQAKYSEPIDVDNYHTEKPFGSVYEVTDDQYCDYINREMNYRLREKNAKFELDPNWSRTKSRKKSKEHLNETHKKPYSQPKKKPLVDNVRRKILTETKQQKEEYHKSWKALLNDPKNKNPTMAQFQLTSIPWPFPTKCLNAAQTDLSFEKLTQELLPEAIVSKSIILNFLDIDFNGPLTPSQISEMKKVLKIELLKWHPDRFHRYHLLPDYDQVASNHSNQELKVALKLINFISQILQESWSHL